MPLLSKRIATGRRGRPTRTELLVWGAALHLAVDWLGQNEWMAEHKHQLVHPAGYLHAATHGAVQALLFPPEYAAGIGVAHLITDTRQPLRLWKKVVTHPDDGALSVSVRIWRDQTAHMITVAAAALLVPKTG